MSCICLKKTTQQSESSEGPVASPAARGRSGWKVNPESSCQRDRASAPDLPPQGGRDSHPDRRGRLRFSASQNFVFYPPAAREDFLFAVFEQRFKAKLFLLLRLPREETGRRGPAGAPRRGAAGLSGSAASPAFKCLAVERAPGRGSAALLVAAGCWEDNGGKKSQVSGKCRRN